jgi:hypothetical protein
MPRRVHHVVLVLVTSSSMSFAQRPQRVNQLLIAAELPVSAAQARNEGASNQEVRGVLDAMRTAKIPAHEARLVIDEERSARRKDGPVDNFGAFVQSKLQAGLRGRDLAAAIRAEHAARGKGKAAPTKAPTTKAKASAPTRTKASAPGKGSAKKPQVKKKPTVDSVRSQKSVKTAAPSAKKPVTKARPIGRVAKPTAGARRTS